MKRILIIHPEGNIHNNPNLLGIVNIICELGYFVDVFSIKRDEIYQREICKNSEHYLFENKHKIPIHEGYVSILSLDEINDETIISFLKTKIKKYDLVIGVDRGILEASLISKIQNIPIGLISYEIFFADETSKAFKQQEIDACSNLSFAVCQDKLRSEKLSEENKIDIKIIINIPVVNRGFNKQVKSDYLYKKLNIPQSKKIAIYTGTLAVWGGTDYLIGSTKHWSDDWVLVLHSRYNDPGMNNKISQFASKRIYLSTESIDSIDDMSIILNSVDLGITYYKPTYYQMYEGKNLEFIGLASGKTFTYLRNGLPVCVNEIGEMSDIIKNNNLGFVFDPNEPLVINFSELDIKGMSENIQKIYPGKFDLNILIEPLLDKIQNLCKTNLVLNDGENNEDLVTNNATFEKWENRENSINKNRQQAKRNNYIKPTNIIKNKQIPKISIVTPNFNQADFLEETILSVLNQNYLNLEYVIIDGGSTDGSIEIIKKYERYLKYWVSEPDKGQYDAVNKGFEHTNGEIMAWLNSDDLYHPNCFNSVSEIFHQNENIDWITCIPNSIKGKNKEEFIKNFIPVFTRDKLLCGLYWNPFIMQEGTFWKRLLWEKAGGYVSTEYKLASDFELWVRFFRHSQIYTVNTLLGCFRLREGQRSNEHIIEYLEEAEKIVRNERKLVSNPKSIELQNVSKLVIPTNKPVSDTVYYYAKYIHAIRLLSLLQRRNNFDLSLKFLTRMKSFSNEDDNIFLDPKISVCITIKDPLFFEKSIISVLNQNFLNTEIILVLQESHFNAYIEDIVKKYKNSLTHIIKSPSQNLAELVGLALQKAKGELFYWLHDNHFLEPGTFLSIAEHYPRIKNNHGLIGEFRLIELDKNFEKIISKDQLNLENVSGNFEDDQLYLPICFFNTKFITNLFNATNSEVKFDIDFWLELFLGNGFISVNGIFANKIIKKNNGEKVLNNSIKKSKETYYHDRSENSIEENIISGNYETALKQLEEIIVKDPSNTDALNNLAVVLAAMGETEDAKRALNLVLYVDPGNKIALENLDKI